MRHEGAEPEVRAGAGTPTRPPGRTAYLALLSVTSLGTISSTVMSAPINEIAATIGATDRGIVLAVSAFTIAMVVTSPVAGWLADRMGPRRYLFVSLGLMVLGQGMAGISDDLTTLVVARTVQGVACSGIPACVQYLLSMHWPHQRRRSMAAWASAIGMGQAVGPVTGGAVAQAFGWRWVFGAAALVVVVVLAVLLRSLPHDRPTPTVALMDMRALVALTVGAGLLAVGLTGMGQGWPGASAALTAVAVTLLAVVLRPGRRPPVLGEVGRDPAYAVTTLAASAAMATMGITLVSVPVYMGTVLALGPGVIGASTLTLAVGMVTFAPVAGRIAGRVGTSRTLAGGLVLIIAATTGLGVAEAWITTVSALAVLLVLLFGVGCGIATVQSMAAVALLDVAGGSGSAMGVHNIGRFSGLCAGYAWLALTLPHDEPVLVHIGSAGVAMVSLMAMLVTSARRQGLSGRRAPEPGRPAPTSR
ncbi:MFS transporter [Janibacter terrae]|uniref:MFS transporter n=1 Tax=Janibacter terrae TaxID=103817 RepID=A0ABZ2FBN1_9MICO|nr:MFS transporter [Janibacter terrae]